MAIIYGAPWVQLYESIRLHSAFIALSSRGRDILFEAFSRVRPKKTRKDRRTGRRGYTFPDQSFTLPQKALTKKFGYKSKTQTLRGIDDALAKGWIERVHSGGCGGCSVESRAVYKLSEKYLDWKDGEIIFKRAKDVHRGFQGENKNSFTKKSSIIKLKRRNK